jgi:hypothetical protein
LKSRAFQPRHKLLDATLTDEELVAVQPATGPGQHAAFRLRMAFDTAFGDGNFRFYIVPGVDPFLNFDATVLPATSSHAALWTQFVFEVIGDIVLLVLGVGDLFGLWDTGDTFGPFDALYPAGIPGHLLAKAVEPLGRDVAIGISADAGESSGLDSIIAEAEEIDPLPELAALAQALAGLGATLTPMGPGPIVRSAVSDPENGTVIGFDLPPDENNLRRADGRGGSRVTGDGIARPLSTVVDVEGRPVTVDVVPENRWHESLFFDNWLGCELRIEADAHRTAFIARRGAFGTPSDFLMLSAAAVEAGVMNGDLVPVERLALSFPWHDGDSGSMFWAVRLGQQAPTWLLGVSAAPRLPLHGASVLRAGFAAQALRDVAQGYGAPFILERWDAIRDTPLGDLAPGNLGVTQRALDGFRDDIVRILGPWFGDRPDGDNVVLAMTPGTLASMLGGDRTEDMRADLAEAKHRLARFLRNAQANVVATIAAGDWDTLVDPEGIGMSDVEARLLEEAVRAHEIVAEASLADVLRRYDVRARPEHWIRAVAATPAVRAVRVEGVVFRADDSTRPHTFDDVFAIRTYQIYPNWTARIRLVSVGYDPSTNFRLRLLVEGVDGQADVVAGARINSVDPLAVGLRANAADLRFEAISESVSLNFQLPEGFPATEPVNGRDRVSVEVSVDNRVIATAVFLMPLVAAVEVELTAAGRTLRDRVAGHADRNAAMRRMQAALPGRVVDADADLDVVPTNPAVDDLLGHLTPRSLPPRRPPPPIPPHPAFRRPGVEARDWDPLDLPPVEVSTAWLHRFPMFDADGGLGKRLRRPASGPMFRIER